MRALSPRSRPIDLGTRPSTPPCSQTDISKFALKFSPWLPMERAVRATRAYLAGIGTAGALALSAAFVFAAASAIIAFRGWPGVNTSSGPARQVVSVTPPPSRVARRLDHIATTVRHVAATRHQASLTARTASHGHAAPSRRAHHTHTVSPTGPGTGTGTAPTTTPSGSSHPARHTGGHRGGP